MVNSDYQRQSEMVRRSACSLANVDTIGRELCARSLDPATTRSNQVSIFRRRRGERGAAAVEFALVVPLLLTFMLGTVELGLYMKDYVSMSSSVRAGARTSSAAAGAGPAYCGASPCSPRRPTFAQAAADTMQTAGMAMNADDINWIMVFKADSTGAVPATCATNCVKYVWNQVSNKFVYSSGVWDSRLVNACLNDKDRESVGVAMEAKHQWMTGLIGGLMGGDKVMTERTIMQFEPLEQNSCKFGAPNAHP